MSSLASMYRRWFDHVLDNYLCVVICEETALEDCRHGPWFHVWDVPDGLLMGSVLVCVGCGRVFTGEDEGVWSRELMRPFAESLS